MVLHTVTEKLNRQNQKPLFINILRWHQAVISSFQMHMLATLFAEANIDEAFRYCVLAEKVENERLPFLQPVRISQKKMMQTLKAIRSQQPKCMKE